MTYRMITWKRASVAAVGVTLALGLTACAPGPSQADDPVAPMVEVQTNTPAPAPADLVGEWTDADPDNADSPMLATVTADTISVYYSSADDGTKALFWVGTFTPPTEAGDYSWTSTADRAQLDASLLGSTDATKVFTYDAATGQLSYPLTMMGTTMTWHLMRA